MRELDDGHTGHKPKIRRRKRRDEILADASTSKHAPRVPRGFPGRAWRTQRAARVSATALPTQPLVIEATASDGDTAPKRPRWASLPLLAVLAVLVIIGGVAWWLRDPAIQQRSTAPPAGFEQITLPGTPDPRSGQMTVTAAADRRVLADFESKLLGQGGINGVIYAGSVDGQHKYLLYAYPSAGPEAARAATKTVAGIHERLGLEDAHVDGLPGGVSAVELHNSKAAVMRALYTSGSFTVQMSVLQDPVGNADVLRAEFRRMVTLVTGALPPEPPRDAGG